MYPTSIFALLLLALFIDWMGLGPEWARDRVAFVFGLVAIRAGWNGSAVDEWTVDALAGWVDAIRKSGNARLAAASTADLIGVAVDLLGVYCFGVLASPKWSRWMGKLAAKTFRKSAAGPAGRVVGRGAGSGLQLNAHLWVCAALLGLLVDLGGGAIGGALNGGVNALSQVAAPIPNFLFGVGGGR